MERKLSKKVKQEQKPKISAKISESDKIWESDLSEIDNMDYRFQLSSDIHTEQEITYDLNFNLLKLNFFKELKCFESTAQL